MTRIAIIDLGTNTFHLLLAAVKPTEWEILHKEKQNVKIGEGGISQGIIAPAATERALKTLLGFKETMDKHKVTQSFAFATSAFRNADNGIELVNRIAEVTGIQIAVISGDQEAQYIYDGVRQALDIGEKNVLIMDIGGGSVEFIIGNNQRVLWKKSYEIGAQRLMDHFHYHDPIYREEIAKLEGLLDNQLVSLVHAMEQYNPLVLIGSSGTFDTLSEIHCFGQGEATDNQSERPLSIDGFHVIHEKIISSTRAERLTIPGMIEMRVDMIVVASCLINYLLRRFAINQIRVSAYALKEGVLEEAIKTVRQNS